jgi:hypothetical protein
MSHKYHSLLYDIPLKRRYLVCTLVPISQLVKSFSMKASRILSFTFFTLNIVWGKPRGGGGPTSWLIEPPVVDLAPTSCTSCSTTNLAIRTPTGTLCTLHQTTWLSTRPLTPIKQVRCMCVVPGAVSSDSWAVLAWNAWVVASWSAVSSDGWIGGRKFATSWG